MMEATENTGNTSYEPLEGRRTFDTSDSPEMEGGGPPKDRRKLVFFALMTAGVGFVLPYNRCVMDNGGEIIHFILPLPYPTLFSSYQLHCNLLLIAY